MGTVIHIDFTKRAGRKPGRVIEARPAEITRLPVPANQSQQAVVVKLDGAFCENVIFAAMPEGDRFRIYQYPRGVCMTGLAQARPVMTMMMSKEELDHSFMPVQPVAGTGLTQAFRQTVALDEGEAALYMLPVKDVHIVVCDGVLEIGKCLNHYQADEAIIEMAHGGVVSGPVEDILSRLTPLDDEARLSLKAMQILLHARTGGPRLDR
jgi:hypothetical protein